MTLLALPDTVDTIVLPLPHLMAKADRMSSLEQTRRPIFFETSREGVVDRQGEDIAASAL